MLVLDSSIVLAWLLPDEQSAHSISIFRRIAEEQAAAPALLRAEVGNGLLAASRRGRVETQLRFEAMAAFEECPIEFIPIEAPHVREAIELGAAHGLSVYDALYLRLAIERGAVLCTYDAALEAAARRQGVSLIVTS